jgi:hypothetical protein
MTSFCCLLCIALFNKRVGRFDLIIVQHAGNIMRWLWQRGGRESHAGIGTIVGVGSS